MVDSINGRIKLKAPATLAISGGVITITNANYYTIAAETGTADELDTINGVGNFELVMIQADSGDTITLRHGTGNLRTADGSDLALSGDLQAWLFHTGSVVFVLAAGAAAGVDGSSINGEVVAIDAHASIPNAVIIPGMAASPDREGFGGGGLAYEFDGGSSPLTWNSAPAGEDVNTTIPSHLYVACSSADTNERRGLASWSPAGDFVATTKLLLGTDGTGAGSAGSGIIVENSDGTTRLLCQISRGAQIYQAAAFTYAGGAYTGRGTNWAINAQEAYLRIQRSGSDVSFWFSTNGLLWQLIATLSFSITVAQIGIRMDSDVSQNYQTAVDFIRADV